MSIIKLRAKVKLLSEENMEMSEDIISVEDKGVWRWRRIGIYAEDILNIIAYKSNKTLVDIQGKGTVLVEEPFDEVYNKWKTNYEAYPEESDAPEENIINKDGEKDSEEDD